MDTDWLLSPRISTESAHPQHFEALHLYWIQLLVAHVARWVDRST